MSDGALRISILGDASQFTKTLSQLQADLEDFQQKLKNATGVDIPDLNFQINGIETSIKQLTEFGKFAQGSLGFYEQLKKQLEGELRVTTNRAEQEQLNKRLVETASLIKEIKSAGIEKPIPVPIVIEPPPPGSIADIKNQISEVLKEKQVAVDVNLTNANIKLRDLKNQLNAAETQGIAIPISIEPPPPGSINDIKNQISELTKQKGIAVGVDLTNANVRLKDLKTELKNLETQGVEIPIAIEPPPPGSIADIKRQISETLKEKEVAIGVNLTNANVKLQGLRNELSVLEKQGIEIEAKPITPVLENSIQGIKNKIDEINAKKVLIDIDDKVGLATINKEIDDLTGQLAKANSVSFDKNGKITENANKANRALTSLSLIAQDLPFGFIAIQNNLPAVFETFGQLRSQSEGVKGVLQTLGASLIGPAGLFLAFSVVTGAVTYAIKEYGSLSNALKVLTGANSDAVKSQVALNKALTEESGNIGGRIAQIKILVDNLNKETVSQTEKLAIYRSLRAISPDLVAGVDELNYATAQSTSLINNNAKAYINLLNIQVKQRAISKVLDELEQKRFAANGKYNAERAKQIELEEKLAAIDAKKGSGKALTAQERTLDRQRKIGRESYAEDVKVASDAIASITAEQDKWTKSLAPLVTETSNADSSFETFRKTLEAFRKSQKEAAKPTKELKQELQGLIPLFDLLLPSKEQFNFDFLKEFFGPNFIKQLKEAQKKINDAQKGIDKFRTGDPFGFLPDQAPNIIPSYESEKENLRLKELAKEFEDARVVLEEVFFAPLSDLFANFFDTGKFAFEEFGKAILNTIKSIVSKIIATGIINLLANMLNPLGGIASAAFGGAATGAGGGIIGAFKAAFNSILGIGKIANPNFGGVQGGGMQLAGEVVFRQRGSDLIGVINRTNGTINRVG